MDRVQKSTLPLAPCQSQASTAIDQFCDGSPATACMTQIRDSPGIVPTPHRRAPIKSSQPFVRCAGQKTREIRHAFLAGNTEFEPDLHQEAYPAI